MKTLDPVTTLPTELILHVLRQLPVADTWRLRLVSKTWKTTLSSEVAVRTALDRHDNKESAEFDLDRRIARFRSQYTGHPLSHYHLQAPIRDFEWPTYSSLQSSAMLRSHLFAHLVARNHSNDNQPRDLQVHDLRTCSTRIWFGQPRRRNEIVGVFLTDTFGGYATDTDIFIADFDSKQNDLKQLELPSIDRSVDGVTAFGQHIALLAKTNFNPDDSKPEPMIWLYDLSDQSTHIWEAPISSEHYEIIGMHINQHRILVFYDVYEPDPSDGEADYDVYTGEICVQSFTMVGEVQWTKTFSYTMDGPGDPEFRDHHDFIDSEVIETGIEDVFAVRLTRYIPYRQIVDLRQGTVTLHSQQPRAAYWKDTSYHLDKTNENKHGFTRCSISFCRQAGNDRLRWDVCARIAITYWWEDRCPDDDYLNRPNHSIFVSNSHLVVVRELGPWSWVFFFSFDPGYLIGPALGSQDGFDWAWQAVKDKDAMVVAELIGTMINSS